MKTGMAFWCRYLTYLQ